MARAGARSIPSVTSRLRGFMSVIRRSVPAGPPTLCADWAYAEATIGPGA